MALSSTEAADADITAMTTHPPADQYLRGQELFDHHVSSVLQHSVRNSPPPEIIAEQWTTKTPLRFVAAYLSSPIRQPGSTIEPTSMEDGKTSVESGAGSTQEDGTNLKEGQNAEMTSWPMQVEDTFQQAQYSELEASDLEDDQDMEDAVEDFISTPSIPKAHPTKAELLFLELLVPEITKTAE
ncbi:hypothetical protein CERZMDRAFT_99770 [Cercospora zeae-maydis SCOH1-5]|uniref:Uncharacterized protein n=1 Tax=Cercospora zeae-maydis SCOH1-5 TaxID=717836 RepID=A0A6A6F9K9_9PEZI|nr:hypothetical protein CERZMDRAFT_99770 [Cercospora zeae-maydis SCOH1-5]